LSANDYLAQRDAAWMAPLLAAAGATVGAIASDTAVTARRSAYQGDVVYIPVTEAGFDVLRDRLRYDPADLVGIRTDAAILDEADAVLLDEAKVPLVLSGAVVDGAEQGRQASRLARQLHEGTDYLVDPDRRTLHLTDAGLDRVEAWFPHTDLFGEDAAVLSQVHTALHAEALLTRDVDYVVEQGRVRLVSQSRGRVEALTRWPEGLQEAVEAKERLAASAGAVVLDQLLVRDLIGLYDPVVGMSATLVSSAEELATLYGLAVGALPPNRPCRRVDEPDQLFATLARRDDAAVHLVATAAQARQPVLVGTQSVAESERFAQLLTAAGQTSTVLNAKNDAAEAAIIAQAGTPGRITVSTQMAGRGTDIRLGAGAEAAGGLLIIGLGRFASRRLDDQLRGRSGRQGDPGRTVFMTSLDDDLVRRHVPDRPTGLLVDDDGRVVPARRSGWRGPGADVVDHAQRVAEGEQASLRDLSIRYGRIPALARRRILRTRQEVLSGDAGLTLISQALPQRMEWLGARVTAEELSAAARRVMLACLDQAWSDFLQYVADVREGIHLRALASEEPLKAFNGLVTRQAASIIPDAVTRAGAIMKAVRASEGRLDLDAMDVFTPGATWTYMVTDNHFGTGWERMGAGLKRLGTRLGRSS
jgi:preprotein translocase subunit SecA